MLDAWLHLLGVIFICLPSVLHFLSIDILVVVMMMVLFSGGKVNLEHLELYLHLCLAVESTSISEVRYITSLLVISSTVIQSISLKFSCIWSQLVTVTYWGLFWPNVIRSTFSDTDQIYILWHLFLGTPARGWPRHKSPFAPIRTFNFCILHPSQSPVPTPTFCPHIL